MSLSTLTIGWTGRRGICDSDGLSVCLQIDSHAFTFDLFVKREGAGYVWDKLARRASNMARVGSDMLFMCSHELTCSIRTI